LRRRWRKSEPRISWAVLAVYVALVLYLASQPRTDPLTTVPYSDKLLHILEYGILGFLSQRAARLTWPQAERRAVWRRLGVVMAAGLGVAAIDELVQAHVPGRMASVADLFADAVGLGLGLTLNLKASMAERTEARATGQLNSGPIEMGGTR